MGRFPHVRTFFVCHYRDFTNFMRLYRAQAGAKNYTDMVILRVISGAAESIADPAFMLITSMWYTRSEQPSRISTWYAANGLGVAGGGLIGYGMFVSLYLYSFTPYG